MGWPISHYTQMTLSILLDEPLNVNTSTTSQQLNSTNNILNLINTCNLPNKHIPKFKNLENEIFHVNEDSSHGKVNILKFCKLLLLLF